MLLDHNYRQSIAQLVREGHEAIHEGRVAGLRPNHVRSQAKASHIYQSDRQNELNCVLLWHLVMSMTELEAPVRAATRKMAQLCTFNSIQVGH